MGIEGTLRRPRRGERDWTSAQMDRDFIRGMQPPTHKVKYSRSFAGWQTARGALCRQAGVFATRTIDTIRSRQRLHAVLISVGWITISRASVWRIVRGCLPRQVEGTGKLIQIDSHAGP